MRIRVSHRLLHSFAPPAKSLLEALRLTPRNHEGQYVVSWRIDTDVDSAMRPSDDAFGNITHQVSVAGPTERLVVTVEGEVETADTAGVVNGTVERFPAILYLRDSAIACADDTLRAYAEHVAEEAGHDPLASLHALMRALHRDIAPGASEPDTTAPLCLAARFGTPQDVTHVFLAAARHLGIPARFVSGYVWLPSGDDSGGPHAWAEAHVDGLGWIGFDPVLNTCPSGAHVRVAVGLDGIGAAPVRSSRAGGTTEEATVRLRSPTQSQSQSQT